MSPARFALVALVVACSAPPPTQDAGGLPSGTPTCQLSAGHTQACDDPDVDCSTCPTQCTIGAAFGFCARAP